VTDAAAGALVDAWPAEHVAVGVLIGDGQQWRRGDPDRRYELASVSKLLVSNAVWIALEEGALELDQPAGPPGSTIRHLLAHASGLPFEGAQPIAEPGARRIYSNTGFEMLAATLEAATEMTWQDYVTAAVLEPLAMSSTTLGDSAARSAHSTLNDLLAWSAEMLTPRLVSSATVTEATSNQFGGLDGVVPGFGQQRPCPWGLGVELKGTKAPHWTPSTGSARTFGHFGAAGTFCWVDPVHRIAAVGLGDLAFGDWAVDLWPRLGDELLGLG